MQREVELGSYCHVRCSRFIAARRVPECWTAHPRLAGRLTCRAPVVPERAAGRAAFLRGRDLQEKKDRNKGFQADGFTRRGILMLAWRLGFVARASACPPQGGGAAEWRRRAASAAEGPLRTSSWVACFRGSAKACNEAERRERREIADRVGETRCFRALRLTVGAQAAAAPAISAAAMPGRPAGSGRNEAPTRRSAADAIAPGTRLIECGWQVRMVSACSESARSHGHGRCRARLLRPAPADARCISKLSHCHAQRVIHCSTTACSASGEPLRVCSRGLRRHTLSIVTNSR